MKRGNHNQKCGEPAQVEYVSEEIKCELKHTHKVIT